MKLSEFKKYIDAAVAYAGSTADYVDVEFWMGEEEVELQKIGQFGVVPNVIITLKPVQGGDNE